jgi:hypothetical protein
LSYKIYNGSAWIDTIVSDGYPGQNATAAPYPTVTILGGQTINISSSLTIPNEIKELKFCTLGMGDGTLNPKQYNANNKFNYDTISNLTSMAISKINITNSNAAIIVSSSGTIDGSCTANDEIFHWLYQIRDL